MAKPCPNCAAPVPRGAHFCPRCGRALADAPSPPQPLHDDKAPLPWSGILFLSAVIAGPALIVLGLFLGGWTLVYVGAGISVAVVVFLILGLFF